MNYIYQLLLWEDIWLEEGYEGREIDNAEVWKYLKKKKHTYQKKTDKVLGVVFK